MRTYHLRWLVLGICLLAGSIVNAQYRFVPHVINENRTDSITFEYRIGDFATHAEFEIDGIFHEMFDDGTNGDRIAGDRIYTIQLDPQEIISEMSDEDAFRPLAGVVHPFTGPGTYKSYDVYLQVRTDKMPDVLLASYGNNDMQISRHVINIRSSSLLNYRQIFQKLSQYGVSRETDFLCIIQLPSRTNVHTYESLRNDVSGLGLPLYNNADPIAPPRFKGVLTLPISSRFDGVSRTVLRSLARQWVPQLGMPFSACGHWTVSDLARSIVGYDSDAIPLCHSENFQYFIAPASGGDFRLVSAPTGVKAFNNMELYLMGLMPPQDVGSFRVFRDQPAVLNALRTNPLGYRGPADSYTISDVIQSVGARQPAFGAAPTDFRVYTVVISPELLTREEMAYYDFMAQRGESDEILFTRDGSVKESGMSFESATDGRATLSWKINNLTFPTRSISADVCFAQTYVFNGVEYEEAGMYSDIIENDSGKDTLVDIELNWLPEFRTQIQDEICEGESYQFHSRTLVNPGTYQDTLFTSIGCDSIVRLELTVNPTSNEEQFVKHCGEYFLFAGDTLRESGVYVDIQQNIYGCDSTRTLTLQIDPDVAAGVISATGNQDYYSMCVEDGLPDQLWFSTTTDTTTHLFVLTDENGLVLDFIEDPVYDFENTGAGVEFVYGVSFSGTFMLNRGDVLFETDISSGCYDISANFIEVHKQTEGAICDFISEKPFDSDVTFTIAPNPTHQNLNIQVVWPDEEPEAADVSLEIIGIGGEVLQRHAVNILPGPNTWSVDVGALANGVYLVRVEGVESVGRFVKI